jgi:hypothetical protein
LGLDVARVKKAGQGSRTWPVVVEPPVLLPALSEPDQAEAVVALTDLLVVWWA